MYLKFSVCDTGCGIKKKDFKLLFKSFSQVGQLTTKQHQGTGLGLAICKYLVQLMSGHIWLEYSEVDKGSCFSFIIPAQLCECISTQENNNKLTAVLKDIKVLIIDDNLHNRLSLAGMVSKWNMIPYVYGTAEEALYFAKTIPFDIGLIDVCMPKIDGNTFSVKLRKIPLNEYTPLIAISSLSDKKNTISSHFKTHMLKPIKEHKLKQMMIDIIASQNFSSKKIQQTQINTEIPYNIKKSIKILLVEDVVINQKVAINFLKKIGYQHIDTAENGQEGLKKLTDDCYDIILLDIRLPILDGEQVFYYIDEYYKKLPKLQNTQYKFKNNKKPYITAMTAYCLKDDKKKYMNIGFDDYIPKPININDLKLCIENFLIKNEQLEELEEQNQLTN